MEKLKFWDSLDEHFESANFSYENILNMNDLIMYHHKISKKFYFILFLYFIIFMTIFLNLYFYFANVDSSMRGKLYILSFVASIFATAVSFKQKKHAKDFASWFYKDILKERPAKIYFYDDSIVFKSDFLIKGVPFSDIVNLVESNDHVFIKFREIMQPIIIDKAKVNNSDLEFLRKMDKYKKYNF